MAMVAGTMEPRASEMYLGNGASRRAGAARSPAEKNSFPQLGWHTASEFSPLNAKAINISCLTGFFVYYFI